MLKLNHNGDATIKCLNLDLFNGGGTAFFVVRIYDEFMYEFNLVHM